MKPNLYTLLTKSGNRMALLFWIALLLGSGSTVAQVATTYSFSNSVGAYNQLTSGTFVAGPGSADDDGNWPLQNIGFTFNYNGNAYTQVGISSNGYLALGAVTTAQYGTALSAIPNCISAFNADLMGKGSPNSSIMIATQGTAPNRVCIVQWRDWGRYLNTNYPLDTLNFQIRLHETGEVRIVYGRFAMGTTLTAGFATQVGITGSTVADFNLRQAGTFVGGGLAGTANTQSMTCSSTNMPDTGRTYTWFQPPMTYDSTIAYQISSAVIAGATNAPILNVKVFTSGGSNPLSVNAMTFNTNGTTSAANILNAKLYYTGTSATFSTANPVGTAVINPNGTFTITGNRVLASGANNFWLTYDVASNASNGNLLDAECSSVTVAGTPSLPLITAPVGARMVAAPLAGTYTVGASGQYTSITAAINDANALGIAGPVTFSLIDPFYTAASGEVFPIVIGNISGLSPARSITIQPATGVNAHILGNSAGYLFELNGTRYINIDGRQGGNGTNALVIENNSTALTSGVINIFNDSRVINVRNATLRSRNNTTNYTTSPLVGTIRVGGTNVVGGTGNDSLNFVNNTFARSGVGPYSTAIVFEGQDLVRQNDVINIDSNNFQGWTMMGVHVASLNSGNGRNFNIRGNSFYDTVGVWPNTTPMVFPFTAVYFNASNANSGNHQITNNFMGGTSPNLGGNNGAGMPRWVINYNTTSYTFLYYFGSSVVNGTRVSGNRVSNMWWAPTTASFFYPYTFYIGSGFADVTDNIMGHETDTNSIRVENTSGGNWFGLYMFNNTNTDVKRNLISNVGIYSNTSFYFCGAYYSSNSNGVVNFDSNTVRSIYSRANYTSSSATLTNITGFYLLNSTPTQNIRWNRFGGPNLIDSIATWSGPVTYPITQTVLNSSTPASTQIVGISVTNGISNISNNYIGNVYSNSNIATSSGLNHAITGIYLTSSINGQQVANNTIRDFFHRPWNGTAMSIVTSGVSGIYSGSGAATIQNNLITNLNITTANTNTGNGSSMAGINVSSSQIHTIANNTITNLTNNWNTATVYSTQLNGIVTLVSNNNTITGNTIRNLSSYGIGAFGSIVGINNLSASVNQVIDGNNISNLISRDSLNNTPRIYGISYNSSAVISGNTSSCSRNIMHGFTHAYPVGSTPTGGYQAGIYFNAGTAIVANNIIRLGRDTSGAQLTRALNLRGIAIITPSSAAIRIYHNNVLIDAAPDYGTGGAPDPATASVHINGVSNAPGFVDSRNNIFVNNSTSSGSSSINHYNYIYSTSATGLTSNFDIISNANTANNFVARFTNLNLSTLADLRIATGLGASTGFGSPNFVNATGSSSLVNLRVASPTSAEGAGDSTVASLVTVDVDGNLRSGLSRVDIGASAGNYARGTDINPPAIYHTPLINASNTGSRSLSAVLFDGSGIATGTNGPRVYYRKGFNSGAWVSTPGTLTSGPASNGTYGFTIDHSLVGGLSLGDTIYYYLVAQDSAAGNIGSLPTGVIAANTNSITQHPLTPAGTFRYMFTSPIDSVIYVPNPVAGATSYPNLTGAGGAFDAINNSVLSRNTTIIINGASLSEPGTVQLNPWNEAGSGGYSLTIRPDGIAQRIIAGNVTANAMLRFNSINNLSILGFGIGGNPNDTGLVLRNASASTPVIQFNEGGSGDTLRSVIIEGNNISTGTAAGGLVNVNPSTLNNFFRNFQMNGCYVRRGQTVTNIPAIGFMASGTAPRLVTQVTITNTTFANLNTRGIQFTTGTGNNISITNNHFYWDLGPHTTTGYYAIDLIPGANSDNNVISGNFIGGSARFASGARWVNSTTPTNYYINVSTGVVTGTTISNNVIANMYFSSTSTGSVRGINVQGTAAKYSIVNNRIGGYDSLTSITSYGNINLYGIYSLTTGDVNISNDSVMNLRIMPATAQASVYMAGIYATSGTSNTLVITNNFVNHLHVKSSYTGTTTLSSVVGILSAGNSTLNQNISNNTVRTIVNWATSATYSMHGILITAGAGNFNNNRVYGVRSASTYTGTTTLVGTSGMSYTASVNGTSNINNNNIDSVSLITPTAATSLVYGLHVVNSGATITINVNNNLVRNVFANTNNTGTNTSAGVTGLMINSIGAVNSNFNNNRVFNIISNPFTPASAVHVYGMLVASSVTIQGNNSLANGNFIHSIASNSIAASTVLAGLNVVQGYVTFSNNMVRMGIDTAGAVTSSNYIQRGIWHQNSTMANYYHNTVMMNGAPTAGTWPAVYTAAFDLTTIIASGQTLDVRNNIFANFGANSGAASSFNLGVRYFDSTRVNSNYNLIHTPNTGGAAGAIGTFNTVYPMLGYDNASFKARTLLDMASAASDPNFDLNAYGPSATATLALQNNNPVERSGDPSLTMVTADYFGNVRSSNTPSDIGAHAGNFTQTPDVFPPQITYTPLTNAGSLTGTRTLTNVVITDNNGIPMTGVNRPRIYYSRDRVTWFNAGATAITGTATNANCSFLIDYLNFTPALTLSDTVFYFVVAQDNTGNVHSNGLWASGTGVGSLTQMPVNPGFYKFLPSIPANSVLSVGVGQTYTSLTNAGGLFEFLNTRTLGGSITVEITSDLTNESGAIALSQMAEDGVGAGNYTVTIRPNAATTTPRVIQGNYLAGANPGLITLLGANRVKFLGIPTGGNATQRMLLFRNTAPTGAYVVGSGSAVISVSSATGVAIRNCIVESGNSNTAGGSVEFRVGVNGLFATTPCSFDTVDNNIMRHNTLATLPDGIAALPGVYSVGNPNVYNSNIVITNNQISNYAVAGVGVVGNNGDGFVISGNSIFYDQSIFPSATLQGIVFIPGAYSNNNTISNNFIGGTAPNCGGSPMNFPLNFGFTGIRTNVGNGANTVVSGNTIQNINYTNAAGTGQFNGILAQAGNTVIDNNQIGHPTITNSINWAQQGSFFGIYYQGVNNILVTNNRVQGISIPTPNSTGQFFGIYVISGSLLGLNGNTIGHATTPNSITINGITNYYGILSSVLNAYVESYSLSNNTVANITATGGGSNTILYGIMAQNSARPLINNNSVFNLQSNGITTSVNGAVSGIFVAAGSQTIPEITGNTVYGIRATTTTAAPTVATGILLSSGQNALISRNRIYDITNSSTSLSTNPAPAAAGINLVGVNINANLYNNQITLGNGFGNNVQLNGIWVNTNNSGVVVNAINNSVLIDGTSNAGAQNTYALLRGNNQLVEFSTYLNLRNNIFANRRTGGSGSHFAISNQASVATNSTWVANTSNYNLFATANAATMGQWGSVNNDVAAWRNNAQSDVLSYYATLGTGAGQLNLNNLFVAPASGNLNLNSANAEVWYVYGKGITGATISNLSVDFANNTRGTTQGMATTIGSFHMTSAPAALPVAATASAAPAANTTTTYTFASRPVASIAWGASAPTAATVYDFTGVTPVNAPAGNVFNRYVRADISGGTAPYNYGITLNFNPANIGLVNNSNNIRIATAASVASPTWTTQNTTVSNATALTSNVSGLSSSGTAILMTGTELAAPPTIVRFNPTAREAGGSVQIIGSLFTGATAVSFNGTSQPVFTVVNDTLITTTVPAGATTGPVSVTNTFGTGVSSTNFIVIPAPAITSFNPTTGTRGSVVTVSGSGFTYLTSVTLNSVSAAFTIVNDNTLTFTVPAAGTTGLIAVTNAAGTATSASAYTVILAPTVTSFTPTSGTAGTSVTITGTNFQFITNVRFNGVDASYTVTSSTSITAIVPQTATTGVITVVNGSGTGTSATNFTVIQAPTINSFTPSSGGIGTVVTISGTNFANIDSVRIGGVNATFTVNSVSQITATVNNGATTGPVIVYRNGIAPVISATNFTVINDLVVNTLQVISSGTYNNITVTGTGNMVLAGNVFALGNMTVQSGGTVNFGTYQVQGNGTFVTNAGSRLLIGAPEGITSTGGLVGNVLMGGTRTYHPGAVYTYNGGVAQVTGNGFTAADTLVITNASGITLSQAATVSNRLNFVAGTLTLGNGNLTMGTNGSITGANAFNYVVTTGTGSLVRTVANNATAVVFPVGSVSYTPVSVTLTAGSVTDQFSVRVNPGVLSAGTSGTPFTTNVVNRTWTINEAVAGGSNATVALTWDDTTELTSFVRSFSAIALYNTTSGQWFSSAYAAATGSNPYTRTRSGLTTFGVFSVGDLSGTLPVEMLTFTGTQSGKDVVLKWTTANEINNSHFVVERSVNGGEFTEVGRVNGKGNTNLLTNYVWVDAAIAEATGAGQLVYRLNQVDLDGRSEVFGPVVVDLRADHADIGISAFPNPFSNVVTVEVKNAVAGALHIEVIDLQGRVVRAEDVNVNEGYQNIHVDGLQELKDGIYLLHVTGNNGISLMQRMVKHGN